MIFDTYHTREKFWDEMAFPNGDVRAHYQNIFKQLNSIELSVLNRKEEIAKKMFMDQGITFTVYSDDKEGIERIFPFDIIPRIITGTEWNFIERGIEQRLKALNLFLHDIYHEQKIIKDEIIPVNIIATCPHYNREVFGIDVPYNIYVHIAGIDLVRDSDGTYYVLEDNLRTPSGVSYMMENRDVTKSIFPELMNEYNVRKVSDYPLELQKILVALAPKQIQNPCIVILTPGIFNSAYYEHTFLARYMGVELVEGRDLVVDNHKVFMKTTRGLKQVDVIYRRVDDEFLDPLVFNPTSLLGVPGLLSAYRKGNVAIVNAMGNGVADDKAIYTFVPDMIRYYLNEEPLLKNVPTYKMENEDERKYVFENMHKMVIKKTNESGGYGMLIGQDANDEEIAKFKIAIEKDPRSYIGQPTVKISTVPCYMNGKLVPRHVDLRPYALYGPDGFKLVAGGLTRVALKENSLVVNSSQGGGSKDTWIID
ncbi:MAG TPA: circularly permuted type 2 ATP-grasp protein [Chitinophagales bacterium]|nr:circularly permuted type 2 ATP-grasp protein [Chitinophagales bacterium]